MKTELEDRILWYDGDTQVSPSSVVDLLLNGVSLQNIYVTEINRDVEKFNQLTGNSLGVKKELKELKRELQIPQSYKDMDLLDYFTQKQLERNDSDMEFEKRIARISNELVNFQKYQYMDMLKVIIYVIDTFREKNVVWGVGRGSSCASYLLFLIGVHLVDPVLYNIPYTEFLHD